MKKIGGITVGGLQQRIFNLMLVFILALVGAYMAVSAYQAKNLERIVREAETGQQASIAAISEETMHAVLQGTLKKSTALQAYIAGDLFGDVKTDVLTLQTLAEEIFAHAEGMPQHAVSGPKAENDGVASVMALHEAGAGGGDSEALGLAANMSEVMLSMFANSEKLSSCFVATPDGNLLIASDRAGNYIDEDGRVRDFPVRERPWYRQAAEAGELIFTGVEEDAYSGIPGLVCAAPVYVGGELKAVVGADIFLDAIRDYVEYASTEGSFLSPASEGVFRPALSSEAPDLRQCGSPELADFVTRAMEAATELEQVEAEGKEYYMAGVPIFSVGWTLLSVVDRSLADLPAQAMLGQYDEISAQAQGAFETGAKHSQQTALVLTLTVLALALVAALYVASRVVKPVELMTRRIRAMRGENLQFQMEKAYRTGDEIEELAESFAKDGAGACDTDSGGHAAEYLSGLSGAFRIRYLCENGSGPGGRRGLLRFLPGGRGPSVHGDGGRQRQGRAGSAVHDGDPDHPVEQRQAGQVAGADPGGHQRGDLREQPGGDVRDGVDRGAGAFHREAHRGQRRARISRAAAAGGRL